MFDPEEFPALALHVPPLSSPKPTDIAIVPLDLEVDKPLQRSTAPLVRTLAVPVLKDKPPNILKCPALLVDTDILHELVSIPAPNTIVMDTPKAVILTPPLITTAPLDVAPALEVRVKLPLPLLDDNLEIIKVPPPVFDPAPCPWSHTHCCGHLHQN